MHYSAISIIYNPNSTGPSKTLAHELRTKLRKAMPDAAKTINVVPTEHPGHAEDLAYELALATKSPLIISSSGDGSYHEVVNGALRAMSEGAEPVCGLLPGGNANDHHRNIHSDSAPIEDLIVSGRAYTIDLLKIETHAIKKTGDNAGKKSKPETWQRYAHSYCGFGLTAEAGSELNKVKLNPGMEALVILKTLKNMRSIRVRVGGEIEAYTSLVCSNVQHMSKILKLSDKAQMHDGKFEITAVRGHSKAKLIGALLKASTTGFDEVKQAKKFIFTTIRPLSLQIDGEIYKVAADTEVRITIDPKVLRCVV